MTASKLDRLVDGLSNGDPVVITIAIAAVVGTVLIFAVTEMIQRRRKRDGK